MVKLAGVEFYRLVGNFEALKREVEELLQISLQQFISSLRHISHLEVVLKLDQDRYELFV